MSRRDQRANWDRMPPGAKPYWNLIGAIRRRERRLLNSMAHTPRPRPADVARWRGMEAEIEQLKQAAAAMRPDLHGQMGRARDAVAT